MKCNKCGFENENNAKFCSWCGEKLQEEVSSSEKKCVICGNVNTDDAKYCAVCGSQLSQKLPNEDIYYQSSVQNTYNVSEDKFGTSSMVVGIVSLVTTILCCMFPLGIFGGIASTVFAIISLKKNGKNSSKAVAGLVCGIIAFVIALIVTISFVSALNDPEFLEELKKAMEQSGMYY